MGLIPNIESIRDFCSQSDLDSFRRFRCVGLAAEVGSQESLPEVCEGLIGSMSARIHNGAVRTYFNIEGHTVWRWLNGTQNHTFIQHYVLFKSFDLHAF